MRSTLVLIVIAAGALVCLPASATAQEATVEAGTRLLEQERWDEAAGVFRAIADREPENGIAWYRLGMALQESGDHAGAIAALERAADLRFQTPYARVRIARAWVERGDEEAALAALETGVEEGLDAPPLLEHEAFASLKGSARFAAVVAAVRRTSAPCVHTPEYRAFDFWVGEWDVFNPAGAQVGQSRIESLLSSCALQENWTDAAGNEGKSLNVFDRATGRWRQLWVSDKGVVTDYAFGDVLEEGALRFEARPPAGEGDSAWRRMVFTPVSPDTVTQEIFLSRDRGETWTSSWLGVYVRKGGR